MFRLGAAFAVTVASFVLVGALAGHGEGFNWELASIFGTAVGTTLLALGTGWLAYLTQQDAAAREKPYVVVTTVAHRGDSAEPGVAGGSLVVALINAGRGPALRVQVTATYVGGEGASIDISEGATGVIAPNLEPVEVTLTYSGQSGSKKELSREDFAISGKFVDRSRTHSGEIEHLDSV